jgi:hypothetical protein
MEQLSKHVSAETNIRNNRSSVFSVTSVPRSYKKDKEDRSSRLKLLLAFASAVFLRSECCGTHERIFLSQSRDSPNLEGLVPVFTSPRKRVARLYPQALGSLFVASYDSQAYGGDIRPRLHTGFQLTHCSTSPTYNNSVQSA